MFLKKKSSYFLFSFLFINFSFSENINNNSGEALEINTEDPENEALQNKCLMIIFDIFKDFIIKMKKEKEVNPEDLQECILNFFSENVGEGKIIDELTNLIKKVNKLNSNLLNIENINNEIKTNTYPFAIAMSSLSILQASINEFFSRDSNLVINISRGISFINCLSALFIFKSFYDVIKIKDVKNKVLKNNSIIENKLNNLFNKLKEKIKVEVEKLTNPSKDFKK